MKPRSRLIWTAGRRRRLKARACTPAGLGLACGPAGTSAFRQAAQPRSPGPRARTELSGTWHRAAHPCPRTCSQHTRTAALRSEPKVPTSVPDTIAFTAPRQARPAQWGARTSPTGANLPFLDSAGDLHGALLHDSSAIPARHTAIGCCRPSAGNRTVTAVQAVLAAGHCRRCPGGLTWR